MMSSFSLIGTLQNEFHENVASITGGITNRWVLNSEVRMIYLILVMFTVFSATQTAHGTQTDLKTRVAQQVERIKLISGH